MQKNIEQELKILEKNLLLSEVKFLEAKIRYENFFIDKSSVIRRGFRLVFLGFLLSSIVGVVLFLIFSRRRLALILELSIASIVILILLISVIYFGNLWGVTGVAFLIFIIITSCLIAKSFWNTKLTNSIEFCDKNLKFSQIEFDKFISEFILPEIHLLTIATVNNVMTKTPAKVLGKDTIIKILEKEVLAKKMELLPLNESSYKSLINHDMESCVLEIE